MHPVRAVLYRVHIITRRRLTKPVNSRGWRARAVSEHTPLPYERLRVHTHAHVRMFRAYRWNEVANRR